MTYRELAVEYASQYVANPEFRIMTGMALENSGPVESRIAAIRGRFIVATIRRDGKKRTRPSAKVASHAV